MDDWLHKMERIDDIPEELSARWDETMRRWFGG